MDGGNIKKLSEIAKMENSGIDYSKLSVENIQFNKSAADEGKIEIIKDLYLNFHLR